MLGSSVLWIIQNSDARARARARAAARARPAESCAPCALCAPCAPSAELLRTLPSPWDPMQILRCALHRSYTA